MHIVRNREGARDGGMGRCNRGIGGMDRLRFSKGHAGLLGLMHYGLGTNEGTDGTAYERVMERCIGENGEEVWPGTGEGRDAGRA